MTDIMLFFFTYIILSAIYSATHGIYGKRGKSMKRYFNGQAQPPALRTEMLFAVWQQKNIQLPDLIPAFWDNRSVTENRQLSLCGYCTYIHTLTHTYTHSLFLSPSLAVSLSMTHTHTPWTHTLDTLSLSHRHTLTGPNAQGRMCPVIWSVKGHMCSTVKRFLNIVS